MSNHAVIPFTLCIANFLLYMILQTLLSVKSCTLSFVSLIIVSFKPQPFVSVEYCNGRNSIPSFKIYYDSVLSCFWYVKTFYHSLFPHTFCDSCISMIPCILKHLAMISDLLCLSILQWFFLHHAY